MADVNDNTKNFIDQLSQGNNDEAGEAFKAALRDKVADQLDNARKDLAGNMFKVPTEAETFSDPKPEIADPEFLMLMVQYQQHQQTLIKKMVKQN